MIHANSHVVTTVFQAQLKEALGLL